MALQCLVDVKIQDAKWFHLIVSLTIILRGKEQVSFQDQDIAATSHTSELLFSGIKAYELSASNSTHQYKKFLVANFEETNNSSFSSPMGWGG